MANKQTIFQNNNSTAPVDDVWLNMINSELKNVCTKTGQTIDADIDQNIKGMAIIASQASLYCVDTGTTNAYVLNPVSPLQAPPVIRTGMSIKFATGNANTGSTNINAYGFGNILVKNQDGTNLGAGDIPANVMVEMYYNGTNWILIKPAATKATTTAQGIVYLNNPITIANNSGNPNTDIDFSGGTFQFSDGSGQAIAPALTKRLQSSGSWSAGAGGNLLTTEARANSSTYHLYAIYNPSTLAVDYMALLGVAGTAPDPTSVLPSGYTKFERRGSILTNSSGNIIGFIQDNKYFSLKSPMLVQNYNISTNSRSAYSISTPLGINVLANIMATNHKATGSSSYSQTYISDLETADIDPIFNSGFETIRCNTSYNGGSEVSVRTNKSAQIGMRTSNSTGSTDVRILLRFWEDTTLKF
jgi:hypothetical protein